MNFASTLKPGALARLIAALRRRAARREAAVGREAGR